MTDDERFGQALKLAQEHKNEQNSIGLLAEKTLHSTLKYYFCPDNSFHEQKYKGFVADVLIDGKNKPQIIEIQTKQVFRMKRKLAAYGDDAHVTIVLPIFARKNVIWTEPSTGEMSKPHKAPRTKTVYDGLAELYGIKEPIAEEKIRIIVLILNGTEHKLLDGYGKNKKIRATKVDIIPESLEKVYFFEKKEDYKSLFPDLPNDTFTADDFRKAVKMKLSDARKVLLLYSELGIVGECGKNGRKKLWKRKD